MLKTLQLFVDYVLIIELLAYKFKRHKIWIGRNLCQCLTVCVKAKLSF